MTGIDLICAERQRQIHEERFDDDWDRQHSDQSIVMAAISYAYPQGKMQFVTREANGLTYYDIPITWPMSWHPKWWKPSVNGKRDRIRDLVKAGALIAAEIDRLQREES